VGWFPVAAPLAAFGYECWSPTDPADG
jgi:hypothetical protein